MAESNEREQKDLNTFHEETDSKTIEKETVNVEDTEKDSNSSTTSIAQDIDEDIANIQAVAIIAVAKSLENVAVSSGEEKPCNLDIAAALNNASETSGGEGSSSDISHRDSRNECQLAADIAENMSRDARLVVAMGQDLIESITSTVQILQSHIRAFSEKAVEATERGDERGYRMADFYHNMSSKYESTVAALERKARSIEVALERVEEAAKECQKYAHLAEEVTDETLDKSKQIKFAACWWTNKGRAAIIVTLKKEHSALLMMRRMWNNVRNDMECEERAVAEDSDEETRECQNRDRKTKIAHIVTTLLGLSLLSITSLFKVGSDSFNAILALGLLTTGWCAIFWSHKLYKCLKERKERTATETVTEQQDGYLENCDRRLGIVRTHLLRFNVAVDSDDESDTGSAETAAVGDDSQAVGDDSQ